MNHGYHNLNKLMNFSGNECNSCRNLYSNYTSEKWNQSHIYNGNTPYDDLSELLNILKTAWL